MFTTYASDGTKKLCQYKFYCIFSDVVHLLNKSILTAHKTGDNIFHCTSPRYVKHQAAPAFMWNGHVAKSC